MEAVVLHASFAIYTEQIQMIPELSTVKLSADKTEMILGQTA